MHEKQKIVETILERNARYLQCQDSANYGALAPVVTDIPKNPKESINIPYYNRWWKKILKIVKRKE